LGKEAGQDKGQAKAAYAQAALKLRTRLGALGGAYGELRLGAGLFTGEEIQVLPELREAYIDAYLGPLDLRLGRQIIAWGRADLLNPTDNLTPRNMMVLCYSGAESRRAARLLGHIEGKIDEAFLDQLLLRLSDSDPELQTHAIYALGRLGSRAQRAVPSLLHLLQQELQQVEAPLLPVLLKALGHITQPADPICEILWQTSRHAEAQAHHRTHLSESTQQRWQEQVERRRALVADALGLMGKAAAPASSYLSQGLLSWGRGARRAAIRALGQMGEEAQHAIPQLTALLNDPPPLAGEALAALTRLDALSTLPQLLQFLDNETLSPRHRLVLALASSLLPRQELPPHLLELSPQGLPPKQTRALLEQLRNLLQGYQDWRTTSLQYWQSHCKELLF